jgi:photoactive yellow protein
MSSDPARDLYSFLRSKDFIPEEENDEESDAESGLRAVDSFEDDDASEVNSDSAASDSAASDSEVSGGAEPPPSDAGSLNFEDDDLGERLRTCSTDELNDAPFGIVAVDDDGVVEFYNRYESEMSGVERNQAVGKNFFTQLAPCSNNRIFLGRFKKGVRTGEMDERFNYTFTYKMRPTLVDIRLYRDEASNNWILVRKR